MRTRLGGVGGAEGEWAVVGAVVGEGCHIRCRLSVAVWPMVVSVGAGRAHLGRWVWGIGVPRPLLPPLVLVVAERDTVAEAVRRWVGGSTTDWARGRGLPVWDGLVVLLLEIVALGLVGAMGGGGTGVAAAHSAATTSLGVVLPVGCDVVVGLPAGDARWRVYSRMAQRCATLRIWATRPVTPGQMLSVWKDGVWVGSIALTVLKSLRWPWNRREAGGAYTAVSLLLLLLLLLVVALGWVVAVPLLLSLLLLWVGLMGHR